MDDTDIKILAMLKENSRVNASVIAENVGMSVSSVTERLKKLENSGVIKQYTIALDSKRIGMDILAFISVSLEHPKFNDSFTTALQGNPNVIECHYITGDFDFLLKIMTVSMDSLSNVLNIIKSIKGVSLTRTLIVLSTSKNEYCIIPELPGD
jgi:Transcriptional regulators